MNAPLKKGPPPPPPIDGNHSKLIRKLPGAFDWKDVALEAYKADTATWRASRSRPACR